MAPAKDKITEVKLSLTRAIVTSLVVLFKKRSLQETTSLFNDYPKFILFLYYS